MKILVRQSRVEVVVINDGKILKKNLKYTGNNDEWLIKQLKEQGYKLKDVFLALCDSDNNLKIYKCLENNPTNDIFE